MGRVTRAAARADPVLADETSTVAESALSEDPAKIALPPSPEKVSDRPPLGEIRVNDQSVAPASSQPAHLEMVDSSDSTSPVNNEVTSSSENENLVLLVVGADDKATVKGKKSNNGTGAAKKPTKKAKETASGPSTEVIEQLRQTLEENVKTFKTRPTQKGRIKTGNKVVEDEETASPSDASSEASDMLKKKGTPGMVAREESSAVAASPAVCATRNQLAQVEPAVSTSKARAVVMDPESPSKAASLEISNSKPGELNSSTAVQKLAMLFQPQPSSPEKPRETTQQQATPNDPIEALDALEEDIEAAENSIAVVEKTASAIKPTATTRSSRISPPEKTTSRYSVKPARAPGRNGRNTLSQTISPTDRALELKRRTIEALNTPEKAKKSSKPPTTSNFQLSSEATAAKLKAQREERQKRREEEEEDKKKQNKLKAKQSLIRTKPTEVKTTAASRARLSLAAEKSKPKDMSTKRESSSVKRASTVTATKTTGMTGRPSILTVMPNGSTGNLQEQSTVARPKAQHHKATSNITVTTAPRLSTLARSSRPVNSPIAKKALSSTVGRVSRPSVTAAAAKRTSLQPKARESTVATKSTLVSETTSKTTNTIKGKEIFSRDKLEQEERERVLKEKMEAAKKARIEAAERGRAASKEWAEKKKKRLAGAAKSGSTSSSEKGEPVTSEQEDAKSDENKENEKNAGDKPPSEKEEPRNSMALEILVNDDIAQDDAAYIVAEMVRIDKLMQGAMVPGTAAQT